MNEFNLNAVNITKYFIRNRYIFKNVSLNIKNSEIVGLIGENGSGKSTLLRIIAGVLSPSSGELNFIVNDKKLHHSEYNKHFSFVAPYLNLYDEFTPDEHYKVTADLRGVKNDKENLDEMLRYFKLYKHKLSQIKGFSSGMKQRMKFITAMQITPEILFLDEPTTNLDQDGIYKINSIITGHAKKGGAVVIATNEDRERDLCSKIYNISEFTEEINK
jgi:ABC-type multidrug transport system ATPase subunit